MNQRWWSWQKIVRIAIVAIATCLIVFNSKAVVLTQPPSLSNLPAPKVHFLPESLAAWQDETDQDNYLSQIDPTPLGYLVWSHFPITVYVQQAANYTNSAADQRYLEWVTAAKNAIAEWKIYLSLQEISERESADIVILRSQPARKAKLNPKTGLYDLPRAVTAETNYKFYLQPNSGIIAHKMKVEISPNYAGIALLATIRHELGHALGIWGHSSQKTDALYFSQVSHPPAISPRDVNTLKQIYQQPTRLGWRLK
jgi:predicted Zn-dependent protease